MAFNIQDFAAEIGQGGMPKLSDFYVMITPPAAAWNEILKAQSMAQLALRISKVTFPGRTLQVQPRQLVGPVRHIPYQTSLDGVQIEVLLSEDMRERQFFMTWQDMFVGNSRTSGAKGLEAAAAYGVGYYDDGVGQMDILQIASSPKWQGRAKGGSGNFFDGVKDAAQALGFDPDVVAKPFGFDAFGFGADAKKAEKEPTASTTLTLHELYPLTISPIDMDWASGEYAKMLVEFRYAYFTDKHRFAEDIALVDEGKSGLRNALEGFNRFIPTLSLLKNAGFKDSALAAGQSFTGPGRSLDGTVQSINPF